MAAAEFTLLKEEAMRYFNLPTAQDDLNDHQVFPLCEAHFSVTCTHSFIQQKSLFWSLPFLYLG